jgi:hypothetical protein
MKSCAIAGVGFQLLLGGWFTATSLAGCGGDARPEPQTPEAAPVVAEPAPEPKLAETPAEAATSPVPDAQPEEKPAAAAAKDPNAIREIKYVVTPEGLKVEVAGVRFLVSADAKQIAQGWGTKVSVKAEATDCKDHVLLSPKRGPVAFAAAVFKNGSNEAERIPDSREGEGELKIGSSAVTFSRDFPNKGGRVLAIGETLDMEVGLWGLGESADDRRPVKQFVHVKMKVDKGKPRAIVEPPASASK